MERIYLQRASSGFRIARGEIVRQIQRQLATAGHDPGTIDGIFGSDTETAIKSFQTQNNQPSTGKLTDRTWLSLMHVPSPMIFDRCLQVTADFEGHGFQKVEGNFDGAGITWGIIGYTLQHGEIQKIIVEVRRDHPHLLDQAFGNLKQPLLTVVEQNWTMQLAWANSISLGTNKSRVEETWAEAFATFGSFPEVQVIQLRRVNDYWKLAQHDAARFSLKTETGVALCFDIAVQNGGIDNLTEAPRINHWMMQNPGHSERDLLLRISDIVAEASNPKWVEDVRARKRTIASGNGQVHGARYSTRDWGIGDFPWHQSFGHTY